jgi:hypothetical protein
MSPAELDAELERSKRDHPAAWAKIEQRIAEINEQVGVRLRVFDVVHAKRDGVLMLRALTCDADGFNALFESDDTPNEPPFTVWIEAPTVQSVH